MLHKAEWMRLELTRVGLRFNLANQYTIWGTHFEQMCGPTRGFI